MTAILDPQRRSSFALAPTHDSTGTGSRIFLEFTYGTSVRLGMAFLLSLGVFVAPPRAAEDTPKDPVTDNGRLDLCRGVVEDFYENAAAFVTLLKDADKLYDMGETVAAADARHESEEAGDKK